MTHKGAYAVGVEWGGRALVVASIYALWDYAWLAEGGQPRYAETSLHRTISDLTPVIDAVNTKASVVVAGDLNASTQHPDPYRNGYRIVHDRVAALGLHNVSIGTGPGLKGCPCADEPCQHVQTYEGATPYQNDYIYASGDVVDAIRFSIPERSTTIEAVSDHFPLVVDLDDG